jgi:hypothetical protein
MVLRHGLRGKRVYGEVGGVSFLLSWAGILIFLDQDLCLSLSNVVRGGSRMLIKSVLHKTNATRLCTQFHAFNLSG